MSCGRREDLLFNPAFQQVDPFVARLLFSFLLLPIFIHCTSCLSLTHFQPHHSKISATFPSRFSTYQTRQLKTMSSFQFNFSSSDSSASPDDNSLQSPYSRTQYLQPHPVRPLYVRAPSTATLYDNTNPKKHALEANDNRLVKAAWYLRNAVVVYPRVVLNKTRKRDN